MAGASLAIPGALLINSSLDGLLEETEAQLPVLATFLRYLVLGSVVFLALKQAKFRSRHFENVFFWPPVTTAIPMGLWILSLGIAAADSQKWEAAGGWHMENALVTLSILASGFTPILWLISKWQTKPSSKSSPDKSSEPRVSSFEDLEELPIEDLLSWLDNESPITQEDEDLFGAKDRGNRIFKALQQKRPNPESQELYKTAVIQGPFGCGKSTIVAFIEAAAKVSKPPQYIFAHVNCWGFSSKAAQEHILDKAISQLSEHVDCLSLHHLPSAYADAMNDSNSWLAAITSVLGSPASPAEVLQRFTPILRAIEAHLIIVIEDTDRNSSDFDQKQIEAMLHDFRQVERMSFVLTAGNSSQIDFPKIAEHLQFVPRLPVKITMTLMDRVRRYCMTHWKFIDPTSRQNRPERLINEDRENVEIERFSRTPSWIGILACLLDNPRILKKTMASIVESWSHLHGEVDLDELIMLSVLRHTAPASFDFLGVHRNEFGDFAPKNSSSEYMKTQREGRLAYLKERWLKVVSKTDHDAHLLGKILGELVWDSTHITGCEVHGPAQRCQSIKDNRGDVYWERISSGAVLASDIRDQEVLASIAKTKDTGDVQHMAEMMSARSDFSELLLRFQKYDRPLDSSIILQATSAALRRMRPLKYGLWNRVTRRFQLIEELIKATHASQETLSAWLFKELVDCLPCHIRDADTLFFDLGRGALDHDSLGEVRSKFVIEVKKSLSSLTSAQFVKCFPHKFPWILSYLVILDRKSYPESFKTQWSHWQWIAPHLLEGMTNCPEVITPQVICALGESGPNGDMPTWFRFDELSLKSLFGERVNEALTLLSQPLSGSQEVEGWFPIFGPLAAKEAKRLLTEGWSTTTSAE